MKITNVRLKIINNVGETNTLLGTASVQFDDCLVVHDIKLLKLKDGKRVLSFPNRKVKKYQAVEGTNEYNVINEYTDIVHPSNKETREYIENELFGLYDKENVDMNEEAK